MSIISSLSSKTVLSKAALELAIAQKEVGEESSESESASSGSSSAATATDGGRHCYYEDSCEDSCEDSFAGTVNVSSAARAKKKRVSSSHSRSRIDESTVSPQHAKRLKKSRDFQQRKRIADAVASVCTDEELHEMLLSKQGQDRFSKTAAMLQANKTEVEAAQAVKQLVSELPAKSTHKQTIVANCKLRGKMTKKYFHTWFRSVSERYGRRAEQIAKLLDEQRAAYDKEARIDIFSQGAPHNGTLNSFHDQYKITFPPKIYAQMVSDAGSVERLVADMKAGNLSSLLSAAFPSTLNKMLKDSDISFRCITKTVPYHWHDNWDRWKAELSREEAKTENRNLQLKQKLKIRCQRAKKHDDCYQVQRSYTQGRIDALEPGSGQWYEYIHNVMMTAHSEATTRYIWDYHCRSEADGGSGEISSLPGPGVRTGDGGGDFPNYEFIYAESCYREKYGIDMEIHCRRLCANHAWNPCDCITTDTTDHNRYYGHSAGYDHNRYYGHDADVIERWIKANPVQPRKLASWGFRELRSLKYSRSAPETAIGKIFVSGVLYASHTSAVNDADRIVIDLRQDSEVGQRCEKCTQRVKHPNGEKCPPVHGTGAEKQVVVHVRSEATTAMNREEKIAFFRKEAASHSKRQKAKKGRFNAFKVAELCKMLRDMGLPSDGLVVELRQRLEENIPADPAARFSSLNTAQCKEKLREMGLPVSGNLAVLRKRLEENSPAVEDVKESDLPAARFSSLNIYYCAVQGDAARDGLACFRQPGCAQEAAGGREQPCCSGCQGILFRLLFLFVFFFFFLALLLFVLVQTCPCGGGSCMQVCHTLALMKRSKMRKPGWLKKRKATSARSATSPAPAITPSHPDWRGCEECVDGDLEEEQEDYND
eukprot:g17243.t1